MEYGQRAAAPGPDPNLLSMAVCLQQSCERKDFKALWERVGDRLAMSAMNMEVACSGTYAMYQPFVSQDVLWKAYQSP